MAISVIFDEARLRDGYPAAGDNNSNTPFLLLSGGYRENSGVALRGLNDATYGQTGLGIFAGWNTGVYGDNPPLSALIERLRITSDGRVGIGTSTPSQRLDVSGAVKASSFFGDGSHLTGISGTSDNDWTIAGSDVYHSSGNVGIGKTSPTRSLDVAGDAAFFDTDQNEILRVENTNAAGGNGIYAVNHASNVYAAAISGKGASTSGDNYGVLGVTEYNSMGNQGSSAGVYGIAASQSAGGDAFGVLAECRTPGGNGAAPNIAAGLYAWGNVATGHTYGVYSETSSSTDFVSGVYGTNLANSGQTRGTIGVVQSTTSGAAGVLGAAPNSGGVYGVLGYCHSTAGYAVYADGNFAIAPGWSLSTSSLTSRGAVQVYPQQSTEQWIEDVGEGRLQDGRTHIELDRTFLETVTISDEWPFKVFVQLNNDCRGVYVQRGQSGFDVVELQGGKSNAAFSYRVIAKRQGFETQRLESVSTLSTASE